MESNLLNPTLKIGTPGIDSQFTTKTSDGKRLGVLVVDEHPVVREGIATLLQNQGDMRLVGKAEAAPEAARIIEELSPDVMLFDLATYSPDSIRDVFSILQKHPSIRVVIFTASRSEEHVYQAIQAGAHGYLLKTSPGEQIIACIQAVSRGERWIPPEIGDVLARRMAAPQLTKRERDVLSVMAQGKSNKEIGQILTVSEGTVKVHVTHILEKLKVSGRTEALATAAGRGLVLLKQPASSTNGKGHELAFPHASTVPTPNTSVKIGTAS